MKLKTIFLITSGFMTLVSCAKERSINPVADANENRFAKSTLTAPGTWLSKATIVNTSSIGGLGFVGLQSETVAGQFNFTKDKLKFVRAFSDESNDSTLPDALNSWDITHSEYRLAESSGVVSNSQEENNHLSWKNKRFFKVDFSKAAIPAFDMASSCWSEVSKELVDESQEITASRISYEVDATYEFNGACAISSVRRFATGQNTHTIRYRVSYIPHTKNENYKPFLYEGENDPVMKRYGYFNSVVESRNPESNRVENKFLMNKWSEGKHTIYFAQDFPEDFKWVYADPNFGVIARTNKIFKDSGINVEFEVKDAPANVKFGDLGYSFFKFVQEDSAASPLGYGPSDNDPLTGEIIGSNSIIWTSSLKFYIDLIKESVRAEDERLNPDSGSSLYAKMQERLNSISKDQVWTDTAETLKFDSKSNGFNSSAGEAFQFLLPDYTFGSFSLYSFGRESLERELRQVEQISEKVAKNSSFIAPESLSKINETLKNTYDFKKLNSEEAQYGFKIYRADTVHRAEEKLVGADKALVRGYSEDQIIDNTLYRVAIHEFGHNLNLRHNFYGSVDGKNFDKNVPAINRLGAEVKDENGEVVMTDTNSASVMDYQSLLGELKEIWNWGAYDRAAITFAYSSGSIDLGAKNNTQYLYCTDEHRSLNAMCNTWDSGTTPTEVVMSLIESYDNSYAYTNYRFGRAYWNTVGYESRALDTMLSLRKFLSFRNQTFGFDMKTLLSEKNINYSADVVQDAIHKDMNKANIIVASFYDAVIRQADAERPWANTYDSWSNALKRQGIASDKIYATLFLLGDIGIEYRPGTTASPYSYVGLIGAYTDANNRDVMEEILTANLTVQPAMEQGFITFGRSLYAETVNNYLYNDQGAWYANIKLECASKDSFQNIFGYSPDAFPKISADGNFFGINGDIIAVERGLDGLDTRRIRSEIFDSQVISNLIAPDASNNNWFQQNAQIGVVEYAGNYLYASSSANKYAFDILKSVHDSPEYSKPSNAQYAFEFYKALRSAKGLVFNGTCE